MEFNDVVLVTVEDRDALYVNNTLAEEILQWDYVATTLAKYSPMHFVVREHLPSDQAYMDEHEDFPQNLAELVNYKKEDDND